MGKKIDRTGEVAYNTNGEKMVIVRFGGAKDIDIQFEDGSIVEHKAYSNFKNGEIKNPMFPSVYGTGYVGVGNYLSCDKNGKHTKCYKTWLDMLRRCYDPNSHTKYTTYINCTVDKNWHNFQNFSQWYYENYYEFGNDERMNLDKDILNKGNKVYSAETCVFVPQFLNKLFTKSDNKRGECPIGVCKDGGKFVAKLNKGKHTQYLGTFNTPNEAFLAYKKAKEAYIKEVAEEYKDKIPYRLYEAMITYEVEIDD